VPAPVVAPELVAGKKVFDKTCGLCHGAGTGGAPRPGDKANWAPRIAQGTETLYKHALEGFGGAAGYMPARGGATVSDADVKAGVDYMVAMSK
jgi:cytochrome c5